MLKKQAPKHTTATEARSRMAETGRKPTPLQAQVLLAARPRRRRRLANTKANQQPTQLLLVV